MTARRPKTAKLMLAAAALLIAGQATTQADAALVYGDFSDIPPGSVMYMNVGESSSSDPVPPPLYGPPQISGNNLDFDPVRFGASSVGALPGADITEGQLNFGFMTVAGKGLAGLTVSETGDLALTGSGTSATQVSAGLFALARITHVNFVELDTPITVIDTNSFSTDLLTDPGPAQPWSQGLTLDFGPALANAGFNPAIDRATKGEVVLNNTLTANTEGAPSTIAQIVKKDFQVNPLVTDAVPEPGTIALIGLGGLLIARRRRG